MADDSKIQMFDPMQPRLERPRTELLEPYQVEEAAEGPDLRAHWRTIQKATLDGFVDPPRYIDDCIYHDV